MRLRTLAAFGAVTISTPVFAEPIIFHGTIEGELGYAINPRLRPGEHQGVGYAGITFEPELTQTTSLSVTTLSGEYNRQQYFSTYNYTDTVSATLSRIQHITEHLTANAEARYFNTDNALLSGVVDPSLTDTTTIGLRTQRVDGSLGLKSQANARDSFTVGINGARVTYGGGRGIASDYDQYGATGGYQHILNARTTIGANVGVSKIESAIQPPSRSVDASLILKRQFSAIWSLDGHVGVILQYIDGPVQISNSTIGFGISLCGAYVRTNICFTADRQSVPSGIGGLRTETGATATLSHKLTEHSNIRFYATYEDTKSVQVAQFRAVSSAEARVDYNRDLTHRLSVGTSVRYQLLTGFRAADSVSGSINITEKIGRI